MPLLLPRSMLDFDDFMRLYRRLETFQPTPSINATINKEESPIFSSAEVLPWIFAIVILCILFWLIQKYLENLSALAKFRSGSKALCNKPVCDSGLPYDPYLKCKNTPLDASLIAAKEPSFKHATIPPRAYCALNRRRSLVSTAQDCDFQWYTPHKAAFSSSNAGFSPGSMRSCYPNIGIWDSLSVSYSTSTPGGSWKGVPEKEKEKRMSSPPAYPQGERSCILVEKECTSKP